MDWTNQTTFRFASKRSMQLPWIKENTFSSEKACHRFALNNAAVKQGMSPEIARLNAHCTNLGAHFSLWTPQQLANHTLRRLAQASPQSSEITTTWTTRKNGTPEPSVPHKMCTTRLTRQVHPQWHLLTKRNSCGSRQTHSEFRTACPYFPLNHATVKQGMWPEFARLEAHCTKSSWTLQLTDTTTIWIPQTQDAWHEHLCHPLK